MNKLITITYLCRNLFSFFSHLKTIFIGPLEARRRGNIFKQVGSITQQAVSSVTNIFKQAGPVSQQAVSSVGTFFNQVGSATQQAGTSAGNFFGQAGSAAGQSFQQAGLQIRSWFTRNSAGVSPGETAIWTAVAITLAVILAPKDSRISRISLSIKSEIYIFFSISQSRPILLQIQVSQLVRNNN